MLQLLRCGNLTTNKTVERLFKCTFRHVLENMRIFSSDQHESTHKGTQLRLWDMLPMNTEPALNVLCAICYVHCGMCYFVALM